MLETKESFQAVVFMSVSQVRPFRKILAKHSAWRIFKSDFFILENSQKGYFKEKTKNLTNNSYTNLEEQTLSKPIKY